MSTVTVSSKGWVVIPSEIRQRYGIQPGDRVQIVDYAGRIAIIPALTEPLNEGRGLLKGGASLTKALRAERKRELAREERRVARGPVRSKAS